MPKRVTSPAVRPAGPADRRSAMPGDSRRATDPGGIIAPLNSALPPLADDPGGMLVGPGGTLVGADHVGHTDGDRPRSIGHADGDGPRIDGEGPRIDGDGPGTADRLDDDGPRAVGEGLGPIEHADGDAPHADGARLARRARRPLSRPVTWVAGGAIAALVAALVAVVAWGGVVLAGDNSVNSARTAVLAVAPHDITVLSTYDYRHLAHDNALVRRIMTAAEWRAYDKPATTVRATIIKDKATATAKVFAVGVVRATANRVTVLAAVQQTINDNLLSGPAVLPRQYEFTFVPVGGQWRVDFVEQL